MTFSITRLRKPVDGYQFKAELEWSSDSTHVGIRVYAVSRLDCEHVLKREVLALIHKMSETLEERTQDH